MTKTLGQKIKIVQKIINVPSTQRKEINLTKSLLDILLELHNNKILQEACSNAYNDNQQIDISHYNVVGQNLSGFDFSNFELQNCIFHYSKFDDETIANIIYRAAEENMDLTNIDCSKSDLSSRKIYSNPLGMLIGLPYSFEKINLTGANFSYANLTGASFKYANLKDVNFSFAILDHATLDFSNIENTNFKSSTILPGQLLLCKNLEQAIFDHPNFIEEVETTSEFSKENSNIALIIAKYKRKLAQYSTILTEKLQVQNKKYRKTELDLNDYFNNIQTNNIITKVRQNITNFIKNLTTQKDNIATNTFEKTKVNLNINNKIYDLKNAISNFTAKLTKKTSYTKESKSTNTEKQKASHNYVEQVQKNDKTKESKQFINK